MEEFMAEFYENDKTPKSVFIILNTPDGKFLSIHRLDHYPLFGEYELTELTYPAKQQLYSQRYYIQHVYKHLLTETSLTLPTIIAKAKKYINQGENYENQSIEQARDILFR